MPRGLPKDVRIHLDKATDSAMLAVEVYNKPATKFRSGGFIVLMCIAWTSLFHAIFLRNRKKPFHRGENGRYIKIDGDYKAWELSYCLDEHFEGTASAVRENLRFIGGLRNKIEHRSMPELDHHIFGECQACLFNFEDMLVKEFGAKHALNESLALALQFSHLRNADQDRAIRALRKPLQKALSDYLTRFRSSLSGDVSQDMQFSYRVFLIPKIANHAKQGDVAIEFVRYDPSNPDQMQQYEKIAALIKPAVTQVANAGCLKASDVCKRVEPVVEQVYGQGKRFVASYHHAHACQLYKIRPKSGDKHPEKTDNRYCHYDAAHKDYVFTEQWVTFLKDELKRPGQYERIKKWQS
jgi:hypothetical protein